jgi:ketosteroid isomerase-like protein
MSEESVTHDPAELTRRAFEAANHHDVDALMRFYAPDAVMDLSDLGIGFFNGAAAIRRFSEEWWGMWGDHLTVMEELVDLGCGVVFIAVREDGRLAGSDSHVEQTRGWIFVWVRGNIENFTCYLDVDAGRAAAERLAESRE